ncbi:MAG TPA: cytochrome c oxidase subunit 3 [Acidimicrobiales bacterium]
MTAQPPGPTDAGPDPADGSPAAPALSPLGVGVVVWLASELMFFAGLFGAYFTLRSINSSTWPPDDVELAVARTGVATLVLVASSFTMHLAVHAVRHGGGPAARRRAVTWLGVTALLGALFLTNQVLEYAEAGFAIDDHAYGSIFYLMTGFHGLHVLGGLVFMGAVAWMVRSARDGADLVPATPTVEVCSYYWHFVDVVWVAMFATIYLLQ